MKRKTRVIKWLLISVSAIFLALGYFVIFEVAPRIRSKSEASRDSAIAEYRRFLIDVAPEAQFENDTCGLHTLRVIYKSYGLDPDKKALRFRLGLDTPANPIDPGSTGTLQPDMFRVLNQDGFLYELVDLNDVGSAVTKLLEHLKGGNMAAVLIARRENGAMHWIAVQRVENEHLVILDSLSKNSYLESPDTFTRNMAISCVLVKPSDIAPNSPDSSLTDGAAALFQSIRRYSFLKKQRAGNPVGGEKRNAP
ncbi:MAG: hypothetical protein H7A53_07275 [Akkermansiaceae bacterium]|nr:hypothetical protein [Akkermansiaceae bacterium]MCP5550673.1 hypothetical protein [Akkermansiaceae bacterium]